MPSTIRIRRQPPGRYRYVRLRWRVLFGLIDLVGAMVFGAARAARNVVRRIVPGRFRQSGRRDDDPRTILLVQLDHLGDAIISTVMLPPLRARYPNASIEVLAGPWNREVFEAAPEVDRVHVSRLNRFARGRQGLGWILAALWWGLALRRRRVDLAIDCRGEFPLAVILWLSGARRRLGWACGGGGFLLTDSPRFVPDRPEVDSRLALLAELGIRPRADEVWRPVFWPSEPARDRAEHLLAKLPRRSGTGAPLCVMHVGAGMRAKQWSAEHWRELIGRLITRLGAQVVLVGSPADRIITRRIAGCRPQPEVADWTGRLSIAELAAVLQRADLAVGADSGPAHLAAAVGTPVVVLFSGTNNPRQWQPAGSRVRVCRHPVDCSPCHRRECPGSGHPCMSGLLPERVAAEVETLLGHRAAEPANRQPPETERLGMRSGR